MLLSAAFRTVPTVGSAQSSFYRSTAEGGNREENFKITAEIKLAMN